MTLEEKLQTNFRDIFFQWWQQARKIFCTLWWNWSKKADKNELYEFIGTLNEEQKEILSVQSSLIESVYRYRSDFYSADDDISCQDFLNGWMKSVMSWYKKIFYRGIRGCALDKKCILSDRMRILQIISLRWECNKACFCSKNDLKCI